MCAVNYYTLVTIGGIHPALYTHYLTWIMLTTCSINKPIVFPTLYHASSLPPAVLCFTKIMPTWCSLAEVKTA